MKRIVDIKGVVHFRNPGNQEKTLCGYSAVKAAEASLFEQDGGSPGELFRESVDSVTCPLCAKVYCAIKNEPWNSVDDDAMEFGMYNAVKGDTEPMRGDSRCPGYDATDGINECDGSGCKYWGQCDYSKECIKNG